MWLRIKNGHRDWQPGLDAFQVGNPSVHEIASCGSGLFGGLDRLRRIWKVIKHDLSLRVRHFQVSPASRRQPVAQSDATSAMATVANVEQQHSVQKDTNRFGSDVGSQPIPATALNVASHFRKNRSAAAIVFNFERMLAIIRNAQMRPVEVVQFRGAYRETNPSVIVERLLGSAGLFKFSTSKFAVLATSLYRVD